MSKLQLIQGRAVRPCAGQVDLFFPAKKSNWRDVARAKAICESCEIQAECLQGAIDRGEEHGIWGGQRFFLNRSKQLSSATKECSWCKVVFTGSQRRTCSTECQRAQFKAGVTATVAKRTRTADCIECGAEFTTTQPARKCCNDVCRSRESRRRRRLAGQV